MTGKLLLPACSLVDVPLGETNPTTARQKSYETAGPLHFTSSACL